MLDARQRMRVLATARSWLGIAYDHAHLDASWQELDGRPTAFDAATFVCRVAIDALGESRLRASAAWFIDHLTVCATPIPGDVVIYQRTMPRAVVHHVMLYAGSGSVIGACDVAGCVSIRSMEYDDPERRWTLLDAPFRVLELR